MNEYKLWFVLLPPLCWCFVTEEAVVKTIGREPDVTPICPYASLHIITLIVCKIRTRISNEECRLLYQYGQDFEHGCDSRFSLITKNETVFLQLTSLTPADSGSYSCECSHARGTDTLHLRVTVKGDAEVSASHMKTLIHAFVIGNVAAFIIVTGVVLGLILKKQHCRGDMTSGPPRLQIAEYQDKDDPNNPYMSLQQPTSDLYQTVLSVHHQQDSDIDSAGNNITTVHKQQETVGRLIKVCEKI